MAESNPEDDIIIFSDDDELPFVLPKPQKEHAQPPQGAGAVITAMPGECDAEAKQSDILPNSSSNDESDFDSDAGEGVVLFDHFDASSSDESDEDDFWLSEQSQNLVNTESQNEHDLSENEALLFDEMTDEEDNEQLLESQVQSQSQATDRVRNFQNAKDISNSEIQAILAEGDTYLPRLTKEMTPGERRLRVRIKLSHIVTSLLGQLVLSTTVDHASLDDGEEEEVKADERIFKTLSLMVTTRDFKQAGKNRKPRLPHFPSHNKGSGGKRFAMILRVIDLVDEALAHNKILTLRDLYYRDKALFGTQQNANRLVDDLAAQLKVGRRDLNIVAAAKGLIYGYLNFETSIGEAVNCVSNPAGCLIPSAEDMKNITFPDDLRYVLVIEKEAIFRSLANEGFHNDRNLGRSLLVTGKGYPDVASRELVHTLCEKLPASVPILCLVDGDPHGLSIFMTYRDGSSAMEHEKATLVAPRLQWLGVTAADMEEAGIDRDYLLSISENDIAFAEKLLKRGSTDAAIKSELRHILKTKLKAEIQILTSVDAEGLVKYLRRKMGDILSQQ